MLVSILNYEPSLIFFQQESVMNVLYFVTTRNPCRSPLPATVHSNNLGYKKIESQSDINERRTIRDDIIICLRSLKVINYV